MNKKPQQTSYFLQEATIASQNSKLTQKSLLSNELYQNSHFSLDQNKNSKSSTNKTFQQKTYERLVNSSFNFASNIKNGENHRINNEKNHQKDSAKKRYKRYIYQLYSALKTIRKQYNQIPEEIIRFKQIALKETLYSKTKFLILDLDQTLVYLDKDLYKMPQNKKISCKMIYRPYLFEFLDAMDKLYEMYVFTSSKKQYAEAVVQKINKNKPYIKDYLHRDHCITNQNKFLYKDLRIIKNRSLQDIVIIDNTVEHFGMQLTNGIPIMSFKGEANDTSLLDLIPFLTEIIQAKDIRHPIKLKYQLQSICTIDELATINLISK